MFQIEMRFILVDSALELVPKEIAKHPAVVKNAKKRNKRAEETLLDVSLHHSAMKKLKESWKRGRPDIVHMCLLTILSDPLVKRDEVLVHTYDSKIIRVDPTTRIPKNYNRFVALIERLLVDGKVPSDGKPLLEVTGMTLAELTQKNRLVLLDEKGELVPPKALCALEDCLIGVGAYPHGDFSDEVKSVSWARYSIASATLEAHQALCRLIAHCY